MPGSVRASKGWSPATISRILDNEKYAGRWVWNKTGTRRDPRTGRRRQYQKPESESIIHEDDALRIAPQQLWESVRRRRKEMHRTWPGGGKRGFSKEQGSRQKHFPDLLAGSMVCGSCGATNSLKLKEAELTAEQRRLANFVDFIGEGRGSAALAKALAETERRVHALTDEVDALRRSRESIFRPPPIERIKERVGKLQDILEQHTARTQLRRSGTSSAQSGSSSSRPTSGHPSTGRSRALTRSP